MAEFHYEYSLDTPPDNVAKSMLRDSVETTRIQWTSGGGGEILRSVSVYGLERWQIRAWTMNDLIEIEGFLLRALRPIAAEEVSDPGSLKMHPSYPEQDMFVGWIFWHWKEE